MPIWHNPSWYGGVCKWRRWWRERKTAENKNKHVIYRDIKDNDTETDWYTLWKVIEEFPDDTHPADMKERLKDEDDDEKDNSRE